MEEEMGRTIRKNGKWAKVSGQRGKWSVAKGWKDEVKAVRVLSYPTKCGALIAANYWVND